MWTNVEVAQAALDVVSTGTNAETLGGRVRAIANPMHPTDGDKTNLVADLIRDPMFKAFVDHASPSAAAPVDYENVAKAVVIDPAFLVYVRTVGAAAPRPAFVAAPAPPAPPVVVPPAAAVPGIATAAHPGVVASTVPAFADVIPQSGPERRWQRLGVILMLIIAILGTGVGGFLIWGNWGAPPAKTTAGITLPPRTASLPSCAAEFASCIAKAAPLVASGLRTQADVDTTCRASWAPATGTCL